jgi:hypothetical protein
MTFFYPELSKMAASTSTSTDRKSTFLVIETGTSIQKDSITQLIVADNYQTWETQVEDLVISIDAEEIVLENLEPPSDTTANELRLFRKILKNTLAILIPTLAAKILAACPCRLSPHDLWTYLSSLYYQENAFNFMLNYGS